MKLALFDLKCFLEVFLFCNCSFNYALNLNAFLFELTQDGGKQPGKCLPVNDVLDVVVDALVISSSVWLDVKCNLGKDRHTLCCSPFIILLS